MRIAKAMSRAGLCSRREAERWVESGRVTINGSVLDTPAYVISENDAIMVDGNALMTPPSIRLWLYHKPIGQVTTHDDPEGRSTVFEAVNLGQDHILSVGRLDINSEGLLLMTNHGGLARALEHPKNKFARTYRVRVRGHINEEQLDALKKGVLIEGVQYGAVHVSWQGLKKGSSNNWLTVTLHEGKNREVRRVMAHCGLQVNRLIRDSYGDFKLGQLKPGVATEISGERLQKLLKQLGNIS